MALSRLMRSFRALTSLSNETAVYKFAEFLFAEKMLANADIPCLQGRQIGEIKKIVFHHTGKAWVGIGIEVEDAPRWDLPTINLFSSWKSWRKIVPAATTFP
jgi:hypothetical protein